MYYTERRNLERNKNFVQRWRDFSPSQRFRSKISYSQTKSHGYFVFSRSNNNSYCSTIYSLNKAKILYSQTKSNGYFVFNRDNNNSHSSTIYSLNKVKISYFLTKSCTFFKMLQPMVNYKIFVYPLQIFVMLNEHFVSNHDLIVF